MDELHQLASKLTDDDKLILRLSQEEGPNLIRTLYWMLVICPGDPGARGLLTGALKEFLKERGRIR